MSTFTRTADGLEKDNVRVGRHPTDPSVLVIQTSSHVLLDADDIAALAELLAQ